MDEQYKFAFKCIVIGTSGCGKSALIERSPHFAFSQSRKLGLGISFYIIPVHLEKCNVKLHIWEIAGHLNILYIKGYSQGSKGCIAVFDLTDRGSLDRVSPLVTEMRKHTANIPLLLVGNKSDLVENRCIGHDDAQTIAQSLNALYLESSAKNGNGIEEIFLSLTALMTNEEMDKERKRSK